MAVANGLPFYQAPALVSKLERDLAFLMTFLATPTDWVVVPELPPQEFLDEMTLSHISLPKYVTNEDYFQNKEFLDIPKGAFRPWGISPAILKKNEVQLPSFSAAYQHEEMSSWKPHHRDLYCRTQALSVLETLEAQQFSVPVIPSSHFPRVCKSVENVDSLLQEFKQVIIKAPWSSSGRGILVLRSNHLNASNKQWIGGIILSQGFVMVEPLLNKVLDLSFHFYVEKGSVQFRGATTFATSKNGQYQGSYLEQFPALLQHECAAFLDETCLNDVQQWLSASLEKSTIGMNYKGVLGVDALLYRDELGKLTLQPCVEINLRHNMGTITLALRKLFPNATGYWKTIFRPQGELRLSYKALREKYPPQFSKDGLLNGFFPLTPVNERSLFASYLVLNSNEMM